jgi:hypothetical protein
MWTLYVGRVDRCWEDERGLYEPLNPGLPGVVLLL